MLLSIELKSWIVAAKKNESIFIEVDLSGWNQEGDREDRLLARAEVMFCRSIINLECARWLQGIQ